MKTSDFKNLKLWNKAMDLTKLVYGLTKSFPEEERYGLTSQIRRCAVSIPSNIAEGHARNSDKEFVHFLKIALGSNAELETQVILSNYFGYLNDEDLILIQNETKSIRKMIISLIKYLNSNNPNNSNNYNNNNNSNNYKQ